MARQRAASVASCGEELLVVRVSDGATLSLESVWQERRVVLIFLRHLGCHFCLEQTDALVQSALARRLQEFGVVLAVVSLGSLQQAREWQVKTGYSGELYIDPNTSGRINPNDPTTAENQGGSTAYKAFRLKRGREFVAGHEETRRRSAAVAAQFPGPPPQKDGDVVIYPGDVLQVGGAFVLGAGNCSDYAVRCNYAGDMLDLSALEAAATGQRTDGSEYVYPSTTAWFQRLEFDTMASVLHSNSLSSCVQPFLQHYWRHAAALYIAVAGLKAFRQKGIALSLGCLGTAGLVAGFIPYIAPNRVSWLMSFGSGKGKHRLAADKVKLFSPKHIDKMAIEAGLMECDCFSVLSSLPMEGETSASDDLECPGPRGRATTWDAAGLDGDSPNEYQTTLCYFRSFLAKPHPSVGRKGPVCPFVPKALQMDTIKLSVVRTSSIPKYELRGVLTQLLLDFIPRFEALEPSTGRQRQYKTVTLVFPDVAIADAHDVIDGAQMDSKPDFVSRGLMVGEFHAANNASGLRNQSFYPLRTPFPSLAIRHMVPGDFVFMTLDNYPVDLQRKFLTSFLDVFGEEDRQETRDARERLKKL